MRGTTGAKASLISTASIWSSRMPARARTFFVAGIGAVSIDDRSTPPSANAWKRARGRSPIASAFCFSMTRTAAALSVIWLELPAVMTPSP
jgi:hypothetical protein